MQLFNTVEKLQKHLSLLEKDKKLGFVPTMGALHPGHASLVAQAVAENETTVVSIFVNPTQFDNAEDLDRYPKTLETDIALLTSISDKIIIFTPSATEIYQGAVTAKKYDFQSLDEVMEGAFRENHFDGVGTIVEALFIAVKPHNAYFGEKDFQQLQIIKKMVADQKIPVTVIGCPIVREKTGLAMSSRNERLSRAMRKEASFIYETLKAAKKKFGMENADKVVEWVHQEFLNHPSLKIEYFEIADSETLTPLVNKSDDKKYRAFIAVYADEVRLIDNIALN